MQDPEKIAVGSCICDIAAGDWVIQDYAARYDVIRACRNQTNVGFNRNFMYSSPKAKEVTMILHYSTEGSLSFKSISSESLVVA